MVFDATCEFINEMQFYQEDKIEWKYKGKDKNEE